MGEEWRVGREDHDDRAAARTEQTWTAIQDWPELDDQCANDALVRQFRPNPFGFYQIIGNVWEWCLDGFDKDFYRLSPAQDPVRLDSPSGMRVLRGGAFDQAAESARSARRHREPPTFKSDSIGVRPARALER